MAVASLVALLAAAAAPVAPAPDASEIVVQGRQQAAIADFVQHMADATQSDQLPRWEGTICSGVVGLDPVQAAFLNGRIADAARIAGLRAGDTGCRPSVLILFTPHADAIAAYVGRRYPVSLRQDGGRRLAAFVKSREPVRWVSQTHEGAYDRSPVDPGFGGAPDILPASNSRIQTDTRAILSFMLVVVDGSRLSHVPLGDVSDYIAMVALSRPRLGASPPRGSILALFEGGAHDGVHALTDYDRSYLAALYRAPVDRNSAGQESVIRSLMKVAPAPAGH